MTTYISMLRGINVAGQKRVDMKALKSLYEGLGFKNVVTYIQSGNVVFESTEKKVPLLIKKIESALQNKFGFEVIVIIRSADEMLSVITKNPFAKKELERVYVTFLSQVPPLVPHDEIKKLKTPTEEYAVVGSEVYFYCPDGYGRTKLSNNFFEKKLKCSGTTRNWKSAMKLSEIASNSKKV